MDNRRINFILKHPFLSILTMSWTLSGLWVYFTPSNSNLEYGTFPNNKIRLKVNEKLIESFISKYSFAPPNLRLLFIFAGKKKYYQYDEFGNRFYYQVLGTKDWLLTSYGNDGKENGIHGPYDASAFSVNIKHIQGLQYKTTTMPHLYPFILLDGYVSPNGKLVGKKFHNSFHNQNFLLVKDIKNSGYVSLARHDRIDEFYWLPHSTKIVFSASGSHRYKDGVYIWDLSNNSTKQILERSVMNPVGVETLKSLWNISLGGIDPLSHSIFLFIKKKKSTDVLLSDFFSVKNLKIYSYKENGFITRNQLKRKSLLDEFKQDFFSGLSMVKGCEEASGLQKKWCELKTSGEFEKVLNQWQEFSSDASETVIFSPSLMILSILYMDVLYLIKEERQSTIEAIFGHQNSRHVFEVMSAYSAEITKNFGNLEVNSLWIDGVANYLWKLHINGQILNKTFSKIQLIDKD